MFKIDASCLVNCIQETLARSFGGRPAGYIGEAVELKNIIMNKYTHDSETMADFMQEWVVPEIVAWHIRAHVRAN